MQARRWPRCRATSTTARCVCPSFPLLPPTFLSHSPPQRKHARLLPGGFPHPLHRWEERGSSEYPALLISQTGSKPPLQLPSLLLLYILYIHTYTHICFFIYIYIFFSLPVQLRDTTGIYLCNEKREIGRSKGIFL